MPGANYGDGSRLTKLNRIMPRLLLYPFRYRDRVTGKWVKARYVAERRQLGSFRATANRASASSTGRYRNAF